MKVNRLRLIQLFSALFSITAAASVTIREEKIASTVLKMDVAYTVILPDGYATSGRQYPVVYWLHDEGGNHQSENEALKNLIDGLAQDPFIDDMIYVKPSGGTNPLWVDSKNGSQKTETFVVTELVKYIDRNYRTKADKDHRAIEGFGTGGFGALAFGMRNTEIFGSILAWCATLYDWQTLTARKPALAKDIFGNDASWFSRSNPSSLLTKNKKALLTNGSIRLVVGAEDPFSKANSVFLAAARKIHVPLDCEHVPDIGHAFGNQPWRIRRLGLRYLSASFEVQRVANNAHRPWPDNTWCKAWLLEEVHLDKTVAKASGVSLDLDLFIPRLGEKPYPLVIWIYGGGWRRGHKRLARSRRDAMLKRGFAYAGITYRLIDKASMPAQIQDCKAAVRWLRANAKKYSLDPERFGVVGVSAGAHLAALLATSGGIKKHTIGKSTMDLEGTVGGNTSVSSRVQAACVVSTPTDLGRMGASSDLVGGNSSEYKDRAALSSPITYVSKDDPPFLIQHGDQDNTVPYEQATLFYNALKKIYAQTGTEVTLETVVGGGHGGGWFSNTEKYFSMGDFFVKHLGGEHEKIKDLLPPVGPTLLGPERGFAVTNKLRVRSAASATAPVDVTGAVIDAQDQKRTMIRFTRQGGSVGGHPVHHKTGTKN